MTAVVDRPTADEVGAGGVSGVADEPFRVDADADPNAVLAQASEDIDEGPVAVAIRPLLVAASTTVGAALMTGGVFGSWFARLVGVTAGLAGVGYAYVSLRSPRRRALLGNLFPLLIVAVGVGSLAVGAKGGPANVVELLRMAIRSGRVLRPPVPFDAGWRPIVIVVLGLTGFAAAWLGASQDKPQLAFIVPVPVLGLTAISQPKDAQLLAGLFGFLPLIVALGVVFGGGSGGSGGIKLDRAFEAKRALRSLAALVPALAALILLNSTSVLFPTPSYDPSSKPQKPKAQSLNAVEDKVLFTVSAPITGPWKLGVLDVYDGKGWRLPPFAKKNQQQVKAAGTFAKERPGDVAVSFTVKDLGTNSSVPGVVGVTSYNGPAGTELAYDRRSGVLRVPAGRVPAGLTYAVSLPAYPSVAQLRAAGPVTTPLDKDLTAIPPAPRAVEDILATAPDNPFDRMDKLLKSLTTTFIAVGEGVPADITPARIQDLIAGKHEGSPYEYVAAQAMLARWAGVPSRIGFGFDGVNIEDGVSTIRPKNAAQWMEVYFEGIGWLPIITAPPKAKASLDNDDAKKFNKDIEAGTDVAVEVYIPVRRDTLRQLYEQIRSGLVTFSPLALALLAAYLGTPAAMRALRRRKRRRWAAAGGPTERIAVEYAELRDLTTDLGVGDPYATPLEFLSHLVEDDQHTELAWLVSRCLYGDIAGQAGPAEVETARDLVESLSRRLRRAQPLQSRVIAVLSRSSLLDPHTDEVPGIASLPRLELRRRVAALASRRPHPLKAVRDRVRASRIERRRARVRATLAKET